MKNTNEFKQKINQLNSSIKLHYSGIGTSNDDIKNKFYETEIRKIIEDGIVNTEEYFNSDLKIMWILKEAYDTEANVSKGYSLVDNLNNKRATGENRTSYQTFDKIIYATYCLIHNKAYDQVYNNPNLSIKNGELPMILRKIAYINIQKLAATSTSNNDIISNHFKEHQSIITTQINSINPDLIIDCSRQNVKKKIGHLLQPNIKFIECWHPAYRRKGQNKFVTHILSQNKI